MPRPLLSATVIATAALIMTGCATLRVSSHTDRGLVWSKYKTFDWGPADALPAGDPRLDKDPFFEDRVEGAIEKAMAGRGFALTPVSGRPDLLVHHHASITERLNVDRIDRGYGYPATVDGRPTVTRYEAGTLIVDIIDRESNVLIWRGWAQGSVEGILGNGDQMRRRIDESVTRMFETLRRAQ